VSVTVENKLPLFSTQVSIVMSDALREGARDTLVNSRTKAPFKKGQLRAESDTYMIAGPLAWRVSYWKQYARFQEKGGDSRRRVRNYTTPGTGAHFLKSAGDATATRIRTIFIKHSGRIRV
jgi:hypothetical protein